MRKKMRCPAALELQSYLDHELAAPRRSVVGAHLIHCADCQARARDLSSAAALLRILAEAPPGNEFAIPAGIQKRRPHGRRWVLLPAAAAGLLALAVGAWRPWISPGADDAFLKVFVEAHQRISLGGGLPQPCDFGLAGDWP